MDRLYRLSPLVLVLIGIIVALYVWPQVKSRIGSGA